MSVPSLAHDASPEAFAAAMVLCQGYGPSCSDAGECCRGGECFMPHGIGYREAKQKLDDLIAKQHDPMVRMWLAIAENYMQRDYEDQRHYMTRARLRTKACATNRKSTGDRA